MKRKILCTIVLSTIVSYVFAGHYYSSENTHKLGIRAGYGFELTYQMPVNNNRIEFDLGYRNKYTNATAIYQWVFSITRTFKWYVGAGADITYWERKKEEEMNGFGFLCAANIGIEHNFSIPLQLTIDWRPSLILLPDFEYGNNSVGVALRYRF